MSPLIVPRAAGRSVLVYHRGAARLWREELARWAAARVRLPEQESHMLDNLHQLAEVHLQATLQDMKKEKVPRYGAFFTTSAP